MINVAGITVVNQLPHFTTRELKHIRCEDERSKSLEKGW